MQLSLRLLPELADLPAFGRGDGESLPGRWFPPEDVVEEANCARCASISYTYTEPTIFFEYAWETASLARDAGIRNVFVTNGYMSRQALDRIAPAWMPPTWI